jgi:hypothetical protein
MQLTHPDHFKIHKRQILWETDATVLIKLNSSVQIMTLYIVATHNNYTENVNNFS